MLWKSHIKLGVALAILLGILERVGGQFMRMQNVEISETGIIELDIMELPRNCFLLISDGKVKIAELQPHAETKIFTYQGQVKRVKFEEGEDF